MRYRAVRVCVLAAVAGCGSNSSSTPKPEWLPAPRVVAAPVVAPPGLDAWPNGSVVYEVFVRSFEDSNADGKGDLEGLIAKLDYLNDGDPTTFTDLGVDAIWLMPVFASPSYHGYDTTDYETVNPDYGTNADLDALIAAAHARGIKVLLDLVLNHTSSQHPWFVDSASSPTSAHRDWYVWSATNPGWTAPWLGGGPAWAASGGYYYYGLFWSGMPDLNYRTQAVKDEVKSIAAFWLSHGIDGFRLDAARYLVEDGQGAGQEDTPETHAFWKEFSAYVRSVKPDATLVGEAWAPSNIIADYYGDTSTLAGGDELPLLFDFNLAGAILSSIMGHSGDTLSTAITTSRTTDPAGATLVPFLTNHDQDRTATQFGGDAGKLASAAGILLTLPGTPFIYYGEEVGLANGTGGGDEAKRTPMPWNDTSAGGGFSTASPTWTGFSPGRSIANVASQTGDPASLLTSYRGLIRARHASGALARGDLQLLQTSATAAAWLRTTAVEQVLVVHNLSSTPQTLGPFAVTGTTTELLWQSTGVKLTGGTGAWTAELPGYGMGAWRIE